MDEQEEQKIETIEQAQKFLDAFQRLRATAISQLPQRFSLPVGNLIGQIVGRLKERFSITGSLTIDNVRDAAFSAQNDNVFYVNDDDARIITGFLAKISAAAEQAFETAALDQPLPPIPKEYDNRGQGRIL